MSKELKKWMPMFWPEYLAGTSHLNTAEHGAYLLLICHYWMKGSVPWHDEALVRRITRMTTRQWALSRDVLRSFFGDDGRHQRCDEELAYAIEKSKRLSANAKLRLSIGRPVADTPTPTPTKKEEEGSSEANASSSVVPFAEARGQPTKYAFECGVIRLNKKDLDGWTAAFPQLDLQAELYSLEAWAKKQPNWFAAVSGALAKRNREAKERIAQFAHQDKRPLTEQEKRAKFTRETGIV